MKKKTTFKWEKNSVDVNAFVLIRGKKCEYVYTCMHPAIIKSLYIV